MLDQFRMLARYNRIANERIYAACAELADYEFRRHRDGSFGSIYGLLNHMLVGDRIWMSRFRGKGSTTPPLGSILFEKFTELKCARAEEDTNIELFFETIDAEFLQTPLRYRNSLGRDYADIASLAVLHFFNHQTHHRGQVHVMISQTGVKPPSLDLHRALNP
ncbi:MAG: damage-inducible protein DinB [Acidobacteria bacterium]|nr:damage-inducible protein DinB [Acidobacteriota bacterium]